MTEKLYIDFDKIETVEDAKIILILLGYSISPLADIIVKQKALDDYPQLLKLCNTRKYSERKL